MVRLDGEIDLSAKPAVLAVAAPLLEAQPGQPLILDMEQLTFLDSSGIAALVVLGRLAGEAGTTLVVQNASDWVRHLLELTGLANGLLELRPPTSVQATG